MNDRHERLRHALRIRVLDHVSAIDDPARALLDQFDRALENFAVGSSAAAARENGNSGGFDDFVVLADVVAGIRF